MTPTHQPTNNEGEKHANLDLRRQQSTVICSKNKSSSAPQDGIGGRPYAQATTPLALRSQNQIFLLAFPILS